jgi:tetratricopeptide (TPR) repeat protein
MGLAMAIHDRSDPRVKEHFERALELDPDSVSAQSNYGLYLLATGDPDGLAHCRRAVALAPSWSRPHFWLAIAYEDLGMFGPAAEEALVAHDLDPKSLQVTYEAARLAQKAGRYEDSLPLLRRLSTEPNLEYARQVQSMIEIANAHRK